MKKFWISCVLGVFSLCGHAQGEYPAKPITLVVATPAGGVTDKTVRLLSRALQNRWKSGILVDNRVGAAGNIASAYVAKAAPDGYTLLVSAGPFAINPSLFKSLPFDTRKDFIPVAQLVSFSSVLLVHESFPATTYQEFLMVAKKPGDPLPFASPGNGTAQHLGMEILRSSNKLNLTHVPYKGGAPAINDLLAGHIKVMLASMGDASPHLKSGRVRALVTTGRTRSPLLPNIPTFLELNGMDFDASGWVGLHAPAGTPPEIVARINSDVAAALNDPALRQGMAAMDVEPRVLGVREFRDFMETQFSKWNDAVKTSGATVD